MRDRSRAAGRRGPVPGRGSVGSVTAETALAMPAVAIVLAVLFATAGTVQADLRCIDAARAAARLAARGESADAVTAAARQLAPAGSRIEVAASGRRVVVTVATVVGLPLGGGGLPVSATATADREQP